MTDLSSHSFIFLLNYDSIKLNILKSKDSILKDKKLWL